MNKDAKTAKGLIYKLTLSNNIEDPSKDIPELKVTQLGDTVFEHQNNKYSITLNGVQFDRKIYQPNEINAELHFMLQETPTKENTILSQSDLQNLLLQRSVTLSVRLNEQTEDIVIAQNYYVHEICPQIVRDLATTQLFVKLKIFSADKVMTLNKYSKAYVAKKLGAEILATETKIFGFKNALVPVYTENLQHLKYMQSGATTYSEFIQPYLVQYNESFYDFMARTANRCGEFLFFEHGKLFLGMPEKKESVTTIKDYASITYQNTSKAPLTIKAFHRDSVKGSEEPAFNDREIAKGSTGYPKDVLGTDYTYNTALAHDEYIFPMVKDKFTSQARIVGRENVKSAMTKLVLDIFSKVVSNTEHYDEAPKSIAKSLIVKHSIDNLTAIKTSISDNAKGNLNWIDKHIADKQHCDGTRYIQFSPVNKEGWVELAYYSKIRSLQEAQQKKIVCVNMDTNLVPVSLGDVINIDKLSGKYVVIQISQSANGREESLSYHKYEDKDAASPIESYQSQQIFAIPMMDNDEVVPPVINMPVVRKSGPQTAFIVDNKDPKNQGRVRIAFPWQAVDDQTNRKLLDEAKAHQEKKEEESKTADNHKESFVKLLDSLKQDIRSMKHLQDELKALPDADSQKKLLDEKISKLDALEKENKASEKDKSLNLALKAVRSKCDEKDAGSPSDTMKAAIENKETNEIPATEKNLSEAKATAEKVDKEVESAKAEVKALSTKWKEKLTAVSSPWVRVATPMATFEGGFYFRPQISDEVIVNFDGENIERPFVAGSLYSKENTDPGGIMTIKSPSGQKMSFDVAYDDLGAVKKLFPFFGNLQGYAPVLAPNLVMGGDARKLCGGISFSDEFGMFNVSMSSTNRAININSPFGNVSIGAFTGINIMSPNGDINIVGKNVTISAGNNLKLTSGTNVQRAGNPTPGGKKVHEPGFWGKIGSGVKGFGGSIIKGARDGAIDAINDKITKGFEMIDVKLIRSLADVFLRPIEGTLCIKSNNYLMLEAGKGKAQVSMERYSENWKQFKKFEPDADKQLFYAKTSAYIKQIQNCVGQFCDEYVELKRDALKKQAEYERKIKIILAGNYNKNNVPKVMEPAFKLGDKEFEPYDKATKKYGTINYDFVTKADMRSKFVSTPEMGLIVNAEQLSEYLIPTADEYAKAAWDLQKKTREFTKCMGNDTIEAVNQAVLSEDKDHMEEKKVNTTWIDMAFKTSVYGDNSAKLTVFLKRWQDRFGSPGSDPTVNFLAKKAEFDKEDVFTNSRLMKRTMVALFLYRLFKDDHNKIELDPAVPAAPPVYGKFFDLCFNAEDTITDDFVMNNWSNVALLGPGLTKWQKRWKSTLKWTGKIIGFKKAHNAIMNESAPYFGWDRQVWNDQSGKIIFSDVSNATYVFEGENIKKWSHAALSNEDMLKGTIKGV